MAAEAAFDCHDELRANIARYRRSRDHLLATLPEAGFPHLSPAEGAFYLFADIGDRSNDSVAFCTRMLNEAGCRVFARGGFRPDAGAIVSCGSVTADPRRTCARRRSGCGGGGRFVGSRETKVTARLDRIIRREMRKRAMAWSSRTIAKPAHRAAMTPDRKAGPLVRYAPAAAAAIFFRRSCHASISCSTVAAVSSIERRVTSITGQPFRLHIRRAHSNSAFTASSST